MIDAAQGFGGGTVKEEADAYVASSSSPAGDTDAVAATAPTEGCGAGGFTTAQLEELLRNYRVRRKLGLLPDELREASRDEELRHLRQTWRPYRFGPSLTGSGAGASSGSGMSPSSRSRAESSTVTKSQLLAEVADLQRHVERGYRELNAERRCYAGLEGGLKRQGESVTVIVQEIANLRAEIAEVQNCVQERVAENRGLSLRLGLEREHQAHSNSQAAVLASAISPLCELSPPVDLTGGGNGSAASVSEELAVCRARITALVADNDRLEGWLGSAPTSRVAKQM